MIIRFLLKTDIEIRLLSVSVSDEKDEPLYHIPNEKGKIKQLLLLHSVYPFVIVLGSIQGPNRKDKPKQAYRQVCPPHRVPLYQNHFLLHNGSLEISQARAFKVSQVAREMVM